MAYINEGNGPSLVANSVATLVITWFFFSIRIYVRWFMMKVWKIEDWLFVGAQIAFTLLSVCALLAAVHGNGQHLIDIQLTDIPLAMQYWFICEIFYVLTAILLRLSFGFFLLRICVNKAHIWTIRVTMAVMSIATIAYFFFVIFQCHPVRYFWLQFSGLVGKCLDATLVQNVTISYSVFAAATDMVFGILPIFVIWNLKMNPKAKIVVGVLLTLGIIAGLSVIVRIEYIKLVNLTDDFLFATSKVSIWSMIEPAISICCLASSTYRPLFSSLKDKATTNYAYGSTANKIGSSYAKKSQITTGSIPEQPNWRLSKSLRAGSNKTGYLRSNNNGANHGVSQSQGSFDDIIALESMASGPGTSPGSKAGSDEREKREGSDKGIWHSTTVEITRQNIDDRI